MKSTGNFSKTLTQFNIIFVSIISITFALRIPLIQPSNNNKQTSRSEAILSIQKRNQSIDNESEKVYQEANGKNNRSDLLVFVPTGLNLTHLPLDLDDFQLLKLDSDILFGKNYPSLPRADGNTNSTPIDTDTDTVEHEEKEDDNDKRIMSRQSRKFNILKGMWNKPKISPLYLVNGTVCRFVNAMPICTTLATTGLIPNGVQTRPTANQFGQTTNNVQLSNNQQPQQFRPSAIMDDDSQDINVESGFNGQNSTDSLNNNINNNRQPQRQPIPQRQQQQQPANSNQYTVVQASRPFNFLVNRRPIPWNG